MLGGDASGGRRGRNGVASPITGAPLLQLRDRVQVLAEASSEVFDQDRCISLPVDTRAEGVVSKNHSRTYICTLRVRREARQIARATYGVRARNWERFLIYAASLLQRPQEKHNHQQSVPHRGGDHTEW